MVYGIPNCDTVKRSRDWLTAHAVNHGFHDFKKQGLPVVEVDRWMVTLGYEKLLNRRGPSWRKLGEVVQATVIDAASAKTIMQANASVIKRPVIVWPGGKITVGFDEVAWLTLLGTP